MDWQLTKANSNEISITGANPFSGWPSAGVLSNYSIYKLISVSCFFVYTVYYQYYFNIHLKDLSIFVKILFG